METKIKKKTLFLGGMMVFFLVVSLLIYHFSKEEQVIPDEIENATNETGLEAFDYDGTEVINLIQNPEEYISIIVEFDDDNNMVELSKELEDELGYAIEIEKTYQIMNGGVIKVKRKDMEKVKDQNTKVWEDINLTIQLQDSVPLINADDVWLEQNATGSNITGEGIIVAILDTGVAYNHSDLEADCQSINFTNGQCDRFLYGWDFYNDDNDPYDDHGHGTHVAGIVGANGSLKGVAPDVSFLVYKVCSSGGSCPTSKIISAVENATLYGADVISISLGGVGPYAESSSLETPFKNAFLNNSIVVIAGGNNGDDGGNYTLSYLATGPYVISVGATEKDDDIAKFSSKGFAVYENDTLTRWIKPDVVAPGVSINSTVPTTICQLCDETGYKVLSGTSMATPHVSGVIALIKQQRPNLNSSDINSLVSLRNIDIGDISSYQGSGRIDALNSYNSSLVITPHNLFFGQDYNYDYQNWSSNRTINITNIGNLSISVDIVGFIGGDSNNISLILSDSQINLSSGETKSINISMEINNSRTNNGDYHGNITFNSNDSLSYKIPIALWVIHNPEECHEDNFFINEDTILNQTTCFYPDFARTGVLIINKSDITLDCNFSTLIGINSLSSLTGVGTGPALSASTGIKIGTWDMEGTIGYFYPFRNVTIQNCNISTFNSGIQIESSINSGDNSVILNSTFYNNANAIHTWYPHNVTIEGNTFSSCGGYNYGGGNICRGIRTGMRDNSVIRNNLFYDNTYGLEMPFVFVDFNDINITGNNFSGNSAGIYSRGIDKIIENNTFNENTRGIYFDGISATNSTVKNNEFFIPAYDEGIRFRRGKNIIVQDNVFTHLGINVDAYYLENDAINNHIINSTYIDGSYSVYFDSSSSNVLIKWYLTVNVTDENSVPIQNVNVLTYENTTGSWVLDWEELTNSNGLIINEPSIQYFENVTGEIYPTLNISATRGGYYSNSTTIYNLSTNTQIHLTLQSGASNEYPIVNLSSPANNSIDRDGNITFECITTDDVNLENISLYGNWSGWHLNQTIDISGVSNTTQFSINNFNNGTYEWNCYVCDDTDQCNFSIFNWTFEVDTSPIIFPNVTLSSPNDDYYFNSTDISLKCNITDESKISNITLYTNISGSAGVEQIISENVTAILILQDADTENVEDAWWDELFGRDGNENYLITQSVHPTQKKIPAIKFSFLNQLGEIKSIEDVNFCLYNYISGNVNVDVFGINNSYGYSWVESVFDSGNDLSTLTANMTNLVYGGIIPFASAWFCSSGTNITKLLNDSYTNNQDNITFYLNTTESGSATFHSKEYTDDIYLRPYLSITYDTNETINLNTSYNATFNLTNIPEGTYEWNCLAYNNNSQSDLGDSNWTFYIDLTNPIMNNSDPTDEGEVVGSSEEIFSIDISDNMLINVLAGLFFWRYPSGNPFTNDIMFCSSSLCQYILDMSGIPDGETLDFYYEIRDMAGNLGNKGTDVNPLTITKNEETPDYAYSSLRDSSFKLGDGRFILN